jgi:hypothetical protein
MHLSTVPYTRLNMMIKNISIVLLLAMLLSSVVLANVTETQEFYIQEDSPFLVSSETTTYSLVLLNSGTDNYATLTINGQEFNIGEGNYIVVDDVSFKMLDYFYTNIPSPDSSANMLFSYTRSNAMTGSGIKSDPYQITNCEQLQDISLDMSAFYELANDIDCEDTRDWNNGKGFEPIGSLCDPHTVRCPASYVFHGTLDGNGKEISNLYINRPSEIGVGLFTGIKEGYVFDLDITNADIVGQSSVGILSGFINDMYQYRTLVEEVYVEGDVFGENVVGGLTGTMYDAAVRDITTQVNVEGERNIGGISGRMAYSTIEDSTAQGTVEADELGGGIVGGTSSEVSFQNKLISVTSDVDVSGADSGCIVGQIKGAYATQNLLCEQGTTCVGDYLDASGNTVTCVEGGTEVTICTETDDHDDPFVQGITYGYDFAHNEATSAKDYCINSNVWEFACDLNYEWGNRDNYIGQEIPCEFGCSNGACNTAPGAVEIIKNPILGETDAPITIVGYMGITEPFSARAWNTIKSLEIDYDGYINFEWRNFPLSFNDPEHASAELAECVADLKGDGTFFNFVSDVYASSDRSHATVQRIAGNYGVRSSDCTATEKYEASVLEDLAQADKNTARGVPTFFVNGERISGAQAYNIFEDKILSLINIPPVVVDPQPTPEVCEDSDGRNYHEKGYVIYDDNIYADSCDENTILEYVCVTNGETSVEKIGRNCPYGCSNGACKSEPDIEEVVCNGCNIKGKCAPIGTRLVEEGVAVFCSFEEELSAQSTEGQTCQNDYSCITNTCSSGVCIDLNQQLEETNSLLRRVANWFSRIFGN